MRLNGTSLRERYGYSAQRLQMVGVDVERCANVACGTPEELLHLEYIYGSNNNGNPREQVIRSAGMNVRQRYDYDGLNRLRQFREEPAGGGPAVLTEDYCYDRHGNRAVLARPGLSAQTPQVATCAEAAVLGLFPGNRIAGTSYDAGGELGSDGWNGLRFDLEGRLRKSIPGSGAETSYEYDGEGRRVVKQTGLSRTVFVYDAAGQLAAEYGSTVSVSGTEFVHGDMLGSTRLVTDGLNPGRRFDYWPFGAELTAGDTAYRTVGFAGAGPAQRFTGKERDAETGLDFFQARYMSSAQGRFTSPDPLGAAAGKEGDPQSWNLYAYARNNPLLYVDPDGLKYRICDTSGNCYDDYSDADFDKNLGGTAKKGVLYDKDGSKIGTYQRTSFDDLSPFGNMFFNQMSDRRAKSNGAIILFAGASVVAGTGVGIGLQATGGAGLTTLESAAPYFRYTPGQLNQLIGGAQRELLKDLFGQGQQGAASRLANFKLPEGITRETLEIYKEAAVRVVQRGPGSPGFEVQKLRLEIVEKALSLLKK
jgi:RHS repeat-associated protein